MKRVVQMLLIVMFAIAPDGAAAKKRAEKPLPATLVSNERPAATAATAQISPEKKQANGDPSDGKAKGKPAKVGPPVEHQLKKAGGGRVFDLRKLPKTPPVPRREKPRPPKEQVLPDPVMIEPGQNTAATVESLGMRGPIATAAAPAPLITFEGLDRENWGAGSPPDTTGDVGPNWYIQAVNTSVGIYRKSDGVLEAGFTFDTLMSQGNFNNLCDTDNFGDPVVLYDTFEDRWILTDFAFATDAGGNVLAPAFQCFAVSMTGNPLTGGWNFYSIQVDDGLHDYEKLGVWTDGIYMSANMFSFGAGSSFRGARAWAINKFQMYAGSPTVQIVSFDIGTGDFTVVPSNARLQTGTPPPGRPNLFISTWNFLNGVSVYKFKVDWDSISLSTFTGPDVPLAGTSWPNAAVGNAPQPGTATLLDVLQIRAMVQNQYTNFGGVESLWVPHTVRRANTTGFATPRWYEVNVTGGAVAATLPQAATWDPDGANVTHRFMPSLAVDRAGNMLMAYSASSATTFPSILYAGRLASDPVNTFSQTEQSLLAGTASQTTSTRWGDYSSAMLDPDGCTFWITNQYANPVSQDSDKRWKTYIGAVRYPECTPVGAGGTISGTVTETPSGLPISGATVRMGVRTAVTNGSGAYTFTSIPAGTYSSIVASMPGYVTSSEASLVVNDGATTTQNFALALAPENACLVDTTQPDFQAGVLTNVSDTVTPGDLKLDRPLVTDQQNTTLGTQGAGFNTVTWLGQTFTAAVSGPVTRVDLNFFSLNCGAVTMPNVTVAIRNAAANLPTGADLATATVTGFCNGAGGWFTAHFATPFTVTAGTQYALVWRAAAAIPAGTPAPGYFGVVSAASGATAVQNPYAGGRRTSSSNSGATWAGATGNANNDHGFIVYVDQGYAPAGTFVSSTKDSNALAGLTPVWGDLTWNATTPANTTVRFQVAASNSINGPFDFVGPNGTAATYFTTSPAPMSQFFDSRYLQYKAYLDTTNTAVTPALHDVTLCYADTDCSGPAPAITPAAAAVCSSATGNTASAPAGMSSYAWSIVNGTITDGATSQTVTYTAGASGTVQLMLSVIEGNGCVKEATPVNVTINAIPATPAASNAGPFCENGTITLSTPLVSGATYAWTGPDGFTSSDRQPSISNATAAMAGAYLVTITVNGCTSPAGSTTVVVNAAPATPTASNGGPYCEGATIALSTPSVSGATYAWTGPGGFTSSDREPSRSNATVAMGGTYAVTITVDGCTSAAGNTNVVVNAAPATPTASNGGPYCEGATIGLSTPAVSGATYAWTGPGGFTSSDREPSRSNATLAMAGTYSVTITVDGCTSLAGTTNVAVSAIPPTPTASNGGPYCEYATIALSTPAVSGATYAWTGPNNFTSSDREPTLGNATMAMAGLYSVTVTVNGCTSPAGSTTVVVTPAPATPAATNGGPYCENATITLSTPAVSGAVYAWTGPNGFHSSDREPAISNATPAMAGTYSVTVTADGCTSLPGTTNVVVNAVPATPTASNAGPYCENGTITLSTPLVSGATYAWTGPGGFTSSDREPSRSNATMAMAGAYFVTVTVNGCTSPAGSTSVVVNAIPATPAASNGGPYCENATITLSTPLVSGATYAWSGPGGFTSSDREPAISNATLADAGSYSVTITVDGCTSAAGSTTVVVNAAPATPTASNGGPYCDNATIVLSTPAVSGATYAWTGPNGFTSPDREPTRSNATPAMAGTYSVTVTVNGCTSLPGTTNVVVNSPQATPTASNGGPYCENATITLSTPVVVGAVYAWTGPNGFTSSDREPAISNATPANAGTYSVTVTVGGCTSLPGTTNVVVNATPATPTISGATSFCPGGSVTLTSSSATGNQWYRNGVLQDGFTQQTYVASVAGDYTVTVTSGSCTSSPSLATTVVANAAPDATITVASTIAAGGSGTASVADAGVGATYAWVVGNGTITAGQGTRSINFTAGAAGALTIDVTVTSGASCSDAEQANVAVTVAPPAVNITTVVPGIASRLGGTPITINGTGFLTGATVTVGGIAATNVVVVNAVQITATTPAHAPGTVAVTVTNLDATTATLAGALVIAPQQFDANGDTTIDPSDIFYLVNYLFTGGPAPIGVAGVLSGDANGDSVVDPSDIFYLVNYLFASGPEPHATTPRTSVQAASAPFGGSLTLGTPYLRGNRWVVPVVFEPVAGGAVPQAVSLKVRMQSAVAPLAVRRAGAAAGAVPSFEISRIGAGELSYLVAFDQTRGALAIHGRTVIAEIELPRAASGRIELDPALTLVTDVTGTRKATEGNGALRLTGTTIAREPREERERPNLGRGGIR
ncbi:MAG TPA: carboxypeptidase regulatory-like domain-containing protein [Thermoanaerobaculia bacterium]|nr:carboxypeptidase regulatory-like domain-containing protein [Thermoanaerobaculia bacterium]